MSDIKWQKNKIKLATIKDIYDVDYIWIKLF